MKTDPDKVVERLVSEDELWYCKNCNELFDDADDLDENDLCAACAGYKWLGPIYIK